MNATFMIATYYSGGPAVGYSFVDYKRDYVAIMNDTWDAWSTSFYYPTSASEFGRYPSQRAAR